jgi:XTP/dITP diphosphohydrolase
VYSARYAGPAATDEQNNRKLLDELQNVPLAKRTAHYVCCVAVADAGGQVRAEAEGRVNGLIANEPHGSYGFGYDPLFLIREYHKTFGQLGPRVKRHLSHRARALERLRPQLMFLLSS